MIRWMVGTSLKLRFLVLVTAAALMAFGMVQLPNTPLDVFPEFAPPRVEIQTPSLGMSAEEVESLITVPLEQAFNGVEGLDIMRSKSIPDLSSIELLFKPGTDELRARQLVQERLAAVLSTMPTWAAPPVIMPPVSSVGRVLKIGMSSKTVPLTDMSMIAYWTIRARLLRVPGVANVPIGDKKKSDGTPLRLADVADVKEGTWPLFGDAVINDGPGLMLVVAKFPWANTLDVTHGVEEALTELRPGLPGIEMDSTIFRPAGFIQVALDNLTRALILGCLLVMLVIGAFLFEWRTALISLVAIPLSLVAGGVVLYLNGATINTMILAWFVIAIGVVVDDAIIDVENIVRRLRQYRKEGSSKSTASIILEASLEVRQAIIHATLIDAVVLLPIFFIGGLSGAFFQPLAIAYGLAVLLSMVVALTVTPALCLLLLARAPIERRQPPLVRWLQRIYASVLTRIIQRPGPVFVATAAIMVVGLVVFPLLGESLFPQF